MSPVQMFATNNGVFQEFLVLVGRIVHSDLVRQIEYLKVENQILRSKLGRRISVTLPKYHAIKNFFRESEGDIFIPVFEC